jgi:hypothetical protein
MLFSVPRNVRPPVIDQTQERQHFSQKLKWEPSDFSSEKLAGGYCLRRPRSFCSGAQLPFGTLCTTGLRK